jgi:hypothetical protein
MRTAVAAATAAGLALAAVVALVGTRAGADEPKATYVGSAKCMKCHSKQLLSWKKTKLFQALEALRPTAEADNKELFAKKKAAGLDPAKDYTTDPKCLACHTTGYGKEGGYPEKITEAAEVVKAAKDMAGVSCESCHGPGSLYLDYKNKKKEEAKKEGKEAVFTKEELAKVGLTTPTEENCRTCHNANNPNNATDTFKFEDAKAKVHEHVTLK